MEYPKRRNGSEYYSKATEPFLKGENGRERYARDKNGNELYPRRKHNLFARNEKGQMYYARDRDGNEFYPCLNGQSIVIPGRIAKFANNTQRYPSDAKGNEYYLQHEGEPYLLRQESGETYLAKTRKGIPMTPWNELHVNDNKPYVCTRDAAGNCVYVHETDLPPSLKSICNCLCHCVTICPSVLGFLLMSTT